MRGQIRVMDMRGRTSVRRSKWIQRVGVWIGLWIGLWGGLTTLYGCGAPVDEPEKMPIAQLVLVSPPSPLGLSYGEQTTLQFRYLVKTDSQSPGEPQAGVTLKLTIDSPTGGGTLSTPTAVTNDLGEASVRLTAGAVESAFHVTVAAPLAPDLVVDVAVSRFAFGTLRVVLDASPVSLGAIQLRAGLYPDTPCSDLPPTAKLMGALRSQRQNGPRGELTFQTLLLQPYAVVGRGEDQSGRLLGYGCVEVPERLLRADLNIPVDVPLSVVPINPAGSYAVDLKLQPQWPIGMPWSTLTCSRGLGVAMVDAILSALGPGDLAMRLLMARGSVDSRGCRTDSLSPSDPDRIVDGLLQATIAGPTLVTVATDFWPALREQTAKSRLSIRGKSSTGYFAEHGLLSFDLKTQSMTQSYSLSGTPVPIAKELAVSQRGDTITVEKHELTVRLPRLWQQALVDLVLSPRGVTMTPGQQLATAITAARYGTQSGCQAIENAICDQQMTPCRGLVLPACQAATLAVSAQLQAVVSDPPPTSDLRLGLTMRMQDPDGMLQAATLTDGVLSGDASLSSGLVKLSGSAVGLRDPAP